jgi:DNA-binding NtrC family response regulator
MMDERTLPRRITGTPLKTIRVEVLAGVDKGRRFVANAESLTVGSAEGNDLVLGDPTVSRYHLELTRVADRIKLADLGSTNGTTIATALLRDTSVLVTPGTVLGIGDTLLRVDDGDVVMVDSATPDVLGGLRGRAPATKRLFSSLLKASAGNVPVLLFGESGTGKELIARAIHDLSDPKKPFATVDCAAMVPTLFASELFGHERGAFTGADRRTDGAFARAHGGTIFLDEIGELSLELQSALLGVAERKRYRRVGGRDEIPVDVRIIAATNRDLRSEVNSGRFRLDLYYRIAVVLLNVPPLRDRREDIPLLVEHFLREAGHDGPVEDVFPPEAMTRLLSPEHTWPGNVRELRNVVESALVMGSQTMLDGESAPASMRGMHEQEPFAALYGSPYKEARRAVLDRFERDYLAALLERTGGNVRQAARDAKMDRSYLTELLKRHGLP